MDKAASDNYQRPFMLPGPTICKKTGCGKMYITVNSDGENKEVLAQLGKSGQCFNATSVALTRMINLALRKGATFEDVIGELKDIPCPSNNVAHEPEGAKSCPDAIARAISESGIIGKGENQSGTGGVMVMVGFVERIVKDVICAYLAVNPEEVEESKSLTDDLGADSLDLMLLLLALEEEFGIEIDENDGGRWRTVGQVVEYIQGRVSVFQNYKAANSGPELGGLTPCHTYHVIESTALPLDGAPPFGPKGVYFRDDGGKIQRISEKEFRDATEKGEIKR